MGDPRRSDDVTTLRREFAEEMKRHGTDVVRNAPLERIERFLAGLQERGDITLRRHDGRVILIWGRD